ncbi:acyl-CoA carboxylase epsilon subunit [Streptomyces sp. BE230]|uniref:acyl-CoA carboxylase epsilon subunit n=1 Tax=Streptomyces sp. BE230 TaxID=3002526 RepID=UPI002ED39C49|nr:acyl-CoA carboxylase epsilon subunit [Streptomyces sp. BE230]
MSGSHVRVVRGAPAPEELAALMVLWARLTKERAEAAAAAAGSGRAGGARPPARAFPMTEVPTPGVGAWRRSGRPS